MTSALLLIFWMQSSATIESADSIARKFKAEVPQFNSAVISSQPCTEFRDSSKYFYAGTPSRLDSVHHVRRSMANGSRHYWIDKISYTPLPKGGWIEKQNDFDLTDNLLVFYETRTFTAPGRMIAQSSGGDGMSDLECLYQYDKRGNLIRQACLNLRTGNPLDCKTYSYDSRNRKFRVQDDKWAKGEFWEYRYTRFDSISAEIAHNPDGSSFPHSLRFFNVRKRLSMEVTYKWSSDSSLSLGRIYQYPSEGKVIQYLMMDTIDLIRPKAHRFGVYECETKEFDAKGRLMKVVSYMRPKPGLYGYPDKPR